MGDNVAFIKRLFNRDTCDNDTLHLQKGHASDTKELPQKLINKAQNYLGYKGKNSKAGKALTVQHIAAQASK